MEQLKLGDILNIVKELKEKGMNSTDIMELPIYIGNDEELNGVHTGWYCQVIDKNNEEDTDIVEMIQEDNCNIQLKEKGILIS